LEQLRHKTKAMPPHLRNQAVSIISLDAFADLAY